MDRVVEIVMEFMETLWFSGMPLTLTDDFLSVLLSNAFSFHRPNQIGPALVRRLQMRFEKMPLLGGVLMNSVAKIVKEFLDRPDAEKL
jgi:hypothetical protein